MELVVDIETNRLEDPNKIWLIVAKDIASGETYVIREREEFLALADRVDLWIGHNILGFDFPVLANLYGFKFDVTKVIDTLIISKLIDFSRQSHSVEDYGREFGLEKGVFSDWSKYSKEMEEYCVRDVEITDRIYRKYRRYVSDPKHRASILLEHEFQLVVNDLHDNGFAFNRAKAEGLLQDVVVQLSGLDVDILTAFPPRKVLVKEFTPRATKHGTISKTSVPRSLWDEIHKYEIGVTYPVYRTEDFNPSSHKQIVRVLSEAGWKPVDKTKTHIEAERRSRRDGIGVDKGLQETGYKINETNLSTLPPNAPKPAHLLAKRILLESRRRTLTEWLGLVDSEDCRIHGKFYGIGAWTHRMAHQNPNTANIPNAVRVSDGSKILLGKEMRALWQAPKNRLLIGVDAEAIQLRVFAHYINDPELTNAIVNGKKSDGTDPHSLNRRYFGSFCKTRNAAKHSLYAIFFGGGAGKIAEIMDCEVDEAKEAIQSLISKYPGLERMQKEVFPKDAKRGYFIGLDGRKVAIPGEELGYRKHLAMSGYLQNGEAVVMKKATLRWYPVAKELNCRLVNFVHDEWQVEAPNDMAIALRMAETMSVSLREVGEELFLNCPLAGSYWNDDHKDYTIGTNWSMTH